MPPLLRTRKPPIWETIINLQKWMAKVLFIILILLIIFNVFGDKEKAQILNASYLPVISAWIGIILGFYFSGELAGIIGEKLKRTEEERDRAMMGTDERVNKAMEIMISTLKSK